MISVDWLGGMAFKSNPPSGNSFVMDLSPDDLGGQPLEGGEQFEWRSGNVAEGGVSRRMVQKVAPVVRAGTFFETRLRRSLRHEVRGRASQLQSCAKEQLSRGNHWRA